VVPQAPEQEPQGPVCQVPSGQAALVQLWELAGSVPEQPAALGQVTVRVWVPVVPQAPEQELQGPVCQVPNGAHAALVQLWELAGGEPEQPAALGQVTVRYCVPLVPQAPEQEPQGPVCQVPSGQGSL